jgi:hypothetical protein
MVARFGYLTGFRFQHDSGPIQVCSQGYAAEANADWGCGSRCRLGQFAAQ